jgi:hypothetical protein
MAEEKIDERRSFLGPDGEEKFFIATPNAEDIRGADWQYSKTYTKCLVEGITTSAEMMDILTRRGIIGPDFEKRARELAQELNRKIEALNQATDMNEKRDLSLEVASAREELYQWNQRLNGPMNNTCESMSDDARLEYLTSCMVQKEDGSRVWKDFDEFITDKSNALPVKARFEVMLFLQGLESNFLEQTPEAVAMREVEGEIIKKAEDALKAAKAAEAELAEEEAAEEAEEETAEEKPKRKYTKSKTSTKKKK